MRNAVSFSTSYLKHELTKGKDPCRKILKNKHNIDANYLNDIKTKAEKLSVDSKAVKALQQFTQLIKGLSNSNNGETEISEQLSQLSPLLSEVSMGRKKYTEIFDLLNNIVNTTYKHQHLPFYQRQNIENQLKKIVIAIQMEIEHTSIEQEAIQKDTKPLLTKILDSNISLTVGYLANSLTQFKGSLFETNQPYAIKTIKRNIIAFYRNKTSLSQFNSWLESIKSEVENCSMHFAHKNELLKSLEQMRNEMTLYKEKLNKEKKVLHLTLPSISTTLLTKRLGLMLPKLHHRFYVQFALLQQELEKIGVKINTDFFIQASQYLCGKCNYQTFKEQANIAKNIIENKYQKSQNREEKLKLRDIWGQLFKITDAIVETRPALNRIYHTFRALAGNIKPRDSSEQKSAFSQFESIIEEKTGIAPNPTMKLSIVDQKRIFNVWLTEIVPLLESKSKNQYTKLRNNIFAEYRSRLSNISLRKFLTPALRKSERPAAVCLELSAIFATFFSSMYGIDCKICNGEIETQVNKTKPSYHAWVEFSYTNARGILKTGVVDFNYTKKVHDDVGSYEQDVQGVNHYRKTRMVDIEQLHPFKSNRLLFKT